MQCHQDWELNFRAVRWHGFGLLPRWPSAWGALKGTNSWWLSASLGGIAFLIFAEPRLRKPQQETIEVDGVGVLRVEGPIREQIQWQDIVEIRIITTSEGPFGEDVFFALAGANGKGCLVPHGAAVRTKLLEELQSRFPNLRNETIIEAMGCTSDRNFLLWKRPDGDM